MLGKADKEPSKESRAALNGYITTLDIVTNPRTKERFIVGGADDGSIAFWTLE